METVKSTDEKVVDVTFQLKGEDAEVFEAYMKREYIRLKSVAAQKLALERLAQLQKEVGELAQV
ncbi:MAG: hypothetical protein QOG71_3602 [Pyrinomonadaceae bacterium]|nr:hypothetical protein [Pyrinomonadaceae bacterium]